MDTIGQCLGFDTFLHLTHTFCHPLVGYEHKLFNELGSLVRLLEISSDGLTLLVYIEMQLFAVEAHGTAFESALTQYLRQASEGAEHFCIFNGLAQ